MLTGEGATNSLLPDWQVYIQAIGREILSEQSPSKLLQVREMLYELLSNCIPADVVLLMLVKELCRNVDDSVKHETVHWGAEYAHRLCMGSKDIFHLEAFVCKFMSIYKKWIVSMFG
ncbi:hypothetical protein EON63_17005 [archaeon]|nr:MAG: hypothetical protein EON63_17005 [archaeon]